MPTINSTKDGGIIRWDESDWLAGLIPQFADKSFTINSFNKGFSWAVSMNPYLYPGYISPGANPTNLINVAAVDTIQKNGVTSGSSAYTIGGDNIQKIDLITNTISYAGSTPFHSITAHSGHTSPLGQDICIYYVSGTKYAFYSWNDNTDGDIGRFDLNTTFDDDYMSAVPTGKAVLGINPHPMIVGDDDKLYIGDGRNLHAYDGSIDTLQVNRLVLPVGYIITTMTKTANYLVVFAYRPSSDSGSYYKSESTAFFWDYVSEDPTYKYNIQGNYVNGAFNYKGVPGCFSTGQNGNLLNNKISKLHLLSGSGFSPILSFPDSIPEHGGVEVADDSITWNAGGTIYQYGSPLVGFGNAINIIAKGSGTTTGGLLKYFVNNSMYVSTGTTTSGGLQVLNAGFDSGATLRVPQVNGVFPLGYKAQIECIRVEWGFKAETTGHKATLTLLYDRNLPATVFNHNLVGAKDLYEEFLYTNPSFKQIGWELTYTAGSSVSATPDILRAIEIKYRLIKL